MSRQAAGRAERACSLGANRMRQMLARRGVVRERFARWAVTDEGSAAHVGHPRGIDVRKV